ncbi:unnamed protein product [Rhodiola kirilowii]
MAFACSALMISSSVLPTTGVKPCWFSSSSSTNKSYVFKKSANTTRGNIRCDYSTTHQQNLGLAVFPSSTTSIPQNGQKSDSKPPTPAIIIRPDELHRSSFPDDFIFGAGTSAIQIEGDGTEGGRGPSTGDYLIGEGKGVDSYNKFKEDVMLLKEMGIPYYRFSIAWSRILPDGTLDDVNPEGVRYYNNLLDELEKNGIKPFVTLFHFDQPEALQKRYNGFMDRRIIQDFTNYCDLCFRLFGDRVKHWISINEAAIFILFTDMCLTPEQRKDPLNQFIAGHHLLLCHAAVAKLYREKYKTSQNGEVGMAIVSKWFEPRSPTSPIDQEAADISLDFLMGWFMHPLKYGEYPPTLKKWVRGLPEFTEEEKSNLIDSCDFFGINYYTAAYTTVVPSGQMLIKDEVTDLRYLIVEKDEREGTLIGPVANGVYKINIYPHGLRKVLQHVKTFYGNQKMYVTENGCSSYPNITMSIPEAQASGKMGEIEKELNDDQRLVYFQLHLHGILQAIKEGANVHGYIFWSLLDNNEFGNYDVRFGLSYVDYFDDHKRYVKKSGEWYADFLSDKPSRFGPALIVSEEAATLSVN